VKEQLDLIRKLFIVAFSQFHQFVLQFFVFIHVEFGFFEDYFFKPFRVQDAVAKRLNEIGQAA